MCIPIYGIIYTSSMFLTTTKTFKFTFTGACPCNICIVYITENDRVHIITHSQDLDELFPENEFLRDEK